MRGQLLQMQPVVDSEPLAGRQPDPMRADAEVRGRCAIETTENGDLAIRRPSQLTAAAQPPELARAIVRQSQRDAIRDGRTYGLPGAATGDLESVTIVDEAVEPAARPMFAPAETVGAEIHGRHRSSSARPLDLDDVIASTG